MFNEEPFTIKSRGRCYTNAEQRSHLETTTNKHGRGTDLLVNATCMDRSPPWGIYAQSAVFITTMGYYGEITIPKQIREQLGVSEGDPLRLTCSARADS